MELFSGIFKKRFENVKASIQFDFKKEKRFVFLVEKRTIETQQNLHDTNRSLVKIIPLDVMKESIQVLAKQQQTLTTNGKQP